MINKKFISELEKIVNSQKIIKDYDILKKYSEDRSTKYKSLPLLVVKPENKEEIQQIVKLCNTYKINITSWGAGTSVTGACLVENPKNNIIISLEKMNNIIEIDTENLIAIVEPGVITSNLKQEVEKFNLFYPPDPASYESSTIGGNISTNAGGSLTVKYGVTRDYVIGLEVILGNGIFEVFGGKCVKNSSGYSLKDLFIGAEGTLGIIVKAYLKLIPKPKFFYSMYSTFNNIYSLLNATNLILMNSILPSSIEYMDDIVLKYLNKKFNLPDPEAKAGVIIQIDGNDENELKSLMLKIYNIVSSIEGFINFYPLENPIKEREVWLARRSIGEVLSENCNFIGKADIVVPRGYVKKVIPEIKEIGKKFNIEVACFGHAGDGNIHVNFLFDSKENYQLILNEVYKKVKEFSGFPSGEHGIGIDKKNFLCNYIGKDQIKFMKEIKKVFDPNNIMNPGKIFNI